MGKQLQEKRFTLVSLDESFFFYDSLVRRVWIEEKKRPVVKVTGSHKHSCLFGATSLEGKQLFRHYDKFNGDTFLDFLKTIRHKFPRCHLFMDKASPHYRSRKVREYFDMHKDTNTGIPSNRVTRVYGDGGGVEHGQARPAGAKTLSILFRF